MSLERLLIAEIMSINNDDNKLVLIENILGFLCTVLTNVQMMWSALDHPVYEQSPKKA